MDNTELLRTLMFLWRATASSVALCDGRITESFSDAAGHLLEVYGVHYKALMPSATEEKLTAFIAKQIEELAVWLNDQTLGE